MRIATAMPSVSAAPGRRLTIWWVIGVVVVVAYAARLIPTLRGGGLSGLQGYDGSVYYAAAAGIAHGLLPYEDFLLLHPPGIAVALLPFALLGRLIGHADALVWARLAWIGLGAVNAVLVSRILAPYGRAAALLGGLGYAVFVPALYVEHSTALEGVASACLLGAMVLLTRDRQNASSSRWFLLAGLLLGISISVKIWGVLILAAVLAWCLVAAGRRLALLVLLGAGLGATAVCLPFFLTAPSAMWRMVVLDQLGRRRVPVAWVDRLNDMAGFPDVPDGHDPLVLILALGSIALGVVLAVRTTPGRLAVVIFAAGWIALLTSPSWSPDYASLTGPALAVIFGSSVASLLQSIHSHRLQLSALVVLTTAVAAYATASLQRLQFGVPFPASAFRTAVQDAPGCVTSDEPSALILTDALETNIARGCPFVVDLGGYSYDLRPGADQRVGRARNPQWNQFALSYLASGQVTMVVRFRNDPGFSASTQAVVESWPVLVSSGGYAVQRPVGNGPGS